MKTSTSLSAEALEQEHQSSTNHQNIRNECHYSEEESTSKDKLLYSSKTQDETNCMTSKTISSTNQRYAGASSVTSAAIPNAPPPPPPVFIQKPTKNMAHSSKENRRMRYIYAYPEEIVSVLPKNSVICRKNYEENNTAFEGANVETYNNVIAQIKTMKEEPEYGFQNNIERTQCSSTEYKNKPTLRTSVDHLEKGEKNIMHKFGSNKDISSTTEELSRSQNRTFQNKTVCNPITAKYECLNEVKDEKKFSVSNLVAVLEKDLNVPALKEICHPNLEKNHHIQHFVNEYFGNTRELQVKVIEEKTIPLQQLKEIEANITNGKKSAGVHLKQLLTIVPNNDEFLFGSNFNSAERIKQKNWQKLLKNDTEDEQLYWNTVTHNGERVTRQCINDTTVDGDLLLIIHQRIFDNIPLDWPELYLIKNAHCRLVAQREKRLSQLKEETLSLTNGSKEKNKTDMVIQRIERELFQDYINYLTLLEKIRLVDSPYTILAFLIMQADSFWYTGKVCSDLVAKKNYYSMAKKSFLQLLEKSRNALTPDDLSVLKILEKLAAILIEYPDKRDVTIRDECLDAVATAQTALARNLCSEQLQQTLRNIEECLISCGSYY